MTDSISFFVKGIPVPKGSMSVIPVGGSGWRVIHDNPRLRKWSRAVADEAGRHAFPSAFVYPCEVLLAFYFERPKTVKRIWPVGKEGDLDKLIRAIFDGLTKGGVVSDDRIIVKCSAEKHYTTPQMTPGVSVVVRALEDGHE